jgi:hypothetical protein
MTETKEPLDRRRKRRVLLALVGGVVAVALTSTAATAGAWTFKITGTKIGIRFRTAADWNTPSGPGGYDGDQFDGECWTWGTPVGAYSNRIWWLGTTRFGKGYIPDTFLTSPNKANQPIPGAPQCGSTPTPPPPSDDGSVYFSPYNGDGPDNGLDADSSILRRNWTYDNGTCNPGLSGGFADVINNRRIRTLSGWSAGRLGPLYFMKQFPDRAKNINRVVLFDPGVESELSDCDQRIGASQVIANWLRSNPSAELMIIAGSVTATNRHAGIQKYYFGSIRGTDLVNRVLVCNDDNADHPTALLRNKTLIRYPLSQCPSWTYGWRP